jgi:hypothetical protein
MKTSQRLAIPFVLAFPLAAQGEHDLAIRAKPGTVVWIEQASQQDQDIDMGGQAMEMHIGTTHTLKLAVKAVDAQGVATVEATIARVRGSMSLPMLGDVEFDSAAGDEAEDEDEDTGGLPSAGGLARAMSALAGKTFVAKVDARGRVQSLDGAAAAVAEARQKAGRAGSQMLTSSLNEGAMRRLVESGFGIVPDKPIAVGGSWERSEVQDSRGARMATKMEIKLTGVTDEAFEVAVAGTIELAKGDEKADKAGGAGDDPDAAMQRAMARNMKVENGRTTGTQRVSRQDGFVLEAASETTMDVTMPGPMGGEMFIAMKSTVTTKRTEADERAAKEPAKDGDGK